MDVKPQNLAKEETSLIHVEDQSRPVRRQLGSDACHFGRDGLNINAASLSVQFHMRQSVALLEALEPTMGGPKASYFAHLLRQCR